MKIQYAGKSNYGAYVKLDDGSFKSVTEPVMNFIKDKVPCEIEVLETQKGDKGKEIISKIKILGSPNSPVPGNKYEPKQEVDWDKINKDKSDDIKQMNAIKSACCLWQNKEWDKDSVEKSIDWLYNYKSAKKSDIAEK